MKKTAFLFIVSIISVITKAQQAPTPRFINNIEVVPETYKSSQFAETDIIQPQSNNTTTQPDAVFSSAEIEKCSMLQFKYALLMNRNVESVSNDSLYSFIDDWIDTRYCYGGKDKEGIDCSAFCATLMNKVFSITIPRTVKEQYSACTKISKKNLTIGDLVFFNTKKRVSHVGVYLGDNYFVHSSLHSGVTIDNLNEDYYNTRYIGGGRIIR
ncbi:MAG: NlpC/P60 family protein [Ferruginibacter sp.]